MERQNHLVLPPLYSICSDSRVQGLWWTLISWAKVTKAVNEGVIKIQVELQSTTFPGRSTIIDSISGTPRPALFYKGSDITPYLEFLFLTGENTCLFVFFKHEKKMHQSKCKSSSALLFLQHPRTSLFLECWICLTANVSSVMVSK